MKKNGFIDGTWLVLILIFIGVITLIIFLCVKKAKSDAAMTLEQAVKLNISTDESSYIVIGVLDEGHVALIMQYHNGFTKPPNANLQYHGVLAINNVNSQVDDIVKVKSYTTPIPDSHKGYSGTYKGSWIEIISIVE